MCFHMDTGEFASDIDVDVWIDLFCGMGIGIEHGVGADVAKFTELGIDIDTRDRIDSYTAHIK